MISMRRTLALLAIVTGLIFAAGQSFYLDQQARAAGFLLLVKPGGGASAQSLVLAAASSQYLSRTYGNAPTNNAKATIAVWVKRASISSGGETTIYDGGIWDAGAESSAVLFASSDILQAYMYNGSVPFQTDSTNTVADNTTWHHLCWSFDSTQATGTNRLRVYLDGVEVSYGTQTPLTQNNSYHLSDNVNGPPEIPNIGRRVATGDRFFDGKMAYYYLIDGQALTPSSFTTGTGSGTTHPATYGGTYGTNGFFLNFTGNSTADQSGNHNDWTQNNSPTFSADLPL